MASVAEVADALDRLVAAAHRQRAAAAATRGDVNATDLMALDAVRRSPRIGPGALARELHLTPGGANGVIRRVLRAELVVRKVSANDRRDVRLEATGRGESLMTTGVGGWDTQLLEDLAGQPDPAGSDMMDLLGRVAAATERRADAFAALAGRLNDPAAAVPVPLRWG